MKKLDEAKQEVKPENELESSDDKVLSIRSTGNEQAIPVLPDPLTGVYPAPSRLGSTKLKPPVAY